MLRLHGYEASINVRKVLWLCAELDLPVELIERGTPARPVSDPAFRKLNPCGRVPVLEDEGFVLAESNTILRYLARRRRRLDLLPAEASEAAEVERWIDWQATDLNDSWRHAFVSMFRDVPGYGDREQIARSLSAFDAHITIIEGRLARTGGHIARAGFSLADIPIGLSLRRWFAIEQDRPQFPRVTAYYQQLCGRAAFLPFGGPASPA